MGRYPVTSAIPAGDRRNSHPGAEKDENLGCKCFDRWVGKRLFLSLLEVGSSVRRKRR